MQISKRLSQNTTGGLADRIARQANKILHGSFDRFVNIQQCDGRGRFVQLKTSLRPTNRVHQFGLDQALHYFGQMVPRSPQQIGDILVCKALPAILCLRQHRHRMQPKRGRFGNVHQARHGRTFIKGEGFSIVVPLYRIGVAMQLLRVSTTQPIAGGIVTQESVQIALCGSSDSCCTIGSANCRTVSGGC